VAAEFRGATRETTIFGHPPPQDCPNLQGVFKALHTQVGLPEGWLPNQRRGAANLTLVREMWPEGVRVRLVQS